MTAHPHPQVVSLEAHAVATSTVSADLTVQSYPDVLLSTAQELLQQGKHEIAVVTAHMACEVATERALSQAFRRRGVSDVEEAMGEFLNGYNLAQVKLQKLYTALSGDDVQARPFWQDFKESARRRNKIMHAALKVSAADTQQSLAAAAALIKHLSSQMT